jgi:hypothetical protein
MKMVGHKTIGKNTKLFKSRYLQQITNEMINHFSLFEMRTAAMG